VFLKVDNVGAERMSVGRLFQVTGPATQNARLPICSLAQQLIDSIIVYEKANYNFHCL